MPGVPRPPKDGVAACVAAGAGVDPNKPPPPNAGVEFGAPKAGVDIPPSPGVAPKVEAVGAGELNWNEAGLGVAAPPKEKAGVDAGAAPEAPKAGVELAPNAGVEAGAPNALPPPNDGVEDPNAGVELAVPKAGVEVVAPNAGVELAPKVLPPNAGADAAAVVPNAGVELGVPKEGAELTPNAGVDEGAPKAGVELAANALPPPNPGVGAPPGAPRAGIEEVPNAGADDAPPNALPPPNDDVLGAPKADVV